MTLVVRELCALEQELDIDGGVPSIGDSLSKRASRFLQFSSCVHSTSVLLRIGVGISSKSE